MIPSNRGKVQKHKLKFFVELPPALKSVNFSCGGACCILGAYLFSRQLPKIRKIVHPIYAELGLIAQSNKG